MNCTFASWRATARRNGTCHSKKSSLHGTSPHFNGQILRPAWNDMLWGIFPARISLPLRQNVDSTFIITFLIIVVISFLLTDIFEASTISAVG